MKKLPLLVGVLFLLGVVSLSFAQEEMVPEIEVKVEVEAEKTKPVKVETITSEQAEESITGQNVFADVINRLPGTQTIYGCAMNSPRLSFRGSTYTYLQMLTEGINLNPIGSCVLQRVPWRGMAEINVVRGPAPVSYPGNTISGVVSMTMKTGDRYPGTGFIATYGTYNTLNFDFVHGGGNETRNWFIAFNRNSNDGWMPNARLDLSDLSFKIVNSPDPSSKWTIAGVFLQGEKGGFKPLGPNISGVQKINPATGKAETIGYFYEHRWPNLRRPGLSITYDKQLSEKTHMMFRVSPVSVTYDLYLKRGLLKDPNTFAELSTAEIETMKMLMRYHLIRAELNYDITLSEGNILSWGVWWEKDWRRATPVVPADSPQLPSWSKQDMSYKGVFVQQTRALTPLQAIVWGLRFDGTDPGGRAVIPFLDYHIRTTPFSDLRIAFTRNKRFPMLDELYGSGINIGNPNLKPPTADVFQLDWERKASNGGKFTTTLFYQKEKDKIISGPNYEWVNLGRSRQRGLELSYEYTAGSTEFWSNYTYLDAKDLTKDAPLIPAYRTAPPKHMLKTGATIKGKNGFSYTAELFWWGERQTDVSSPTIQKWFKENGEIITVTTPSSLPSSLIFNIRITKTLPQGRAFTLSIQNLFDKQWQEMVFYPREGRWVMLSFSQKF